MRSCIFTILVIGALALAGFWILTEKETVTKIAYLPPESIADVVDLVEPAVVYISVDYPRGVKTGSGVILDPEGYILTNNHVVEGARKIEVTLPDNPEIFPADLIGTDNLSDLAVIKIEGDNFPTAEFGDASQLREGDWVVAIGNALGLAGGPTVTAGIVSNLERSFTFGGSTYYDTIQTDAAINRGNSGGPLVNLEAKVIGINTFIISGTENMGFAISQTTAQPVYEDLKEDGEVIRAYLGVSLYTLTPDLATMLGLTRDRGVLVLEVAPGTPAAEAGLRENDVITRFEDEEVNEATQLTKLLWQHEPGDTVKITFWRGDQEMSVWVTLAQRPVEL